jgi:WXG100 family type VII secretion target
MALSRISPREMRSIANNIEQLAVDYTRQVQSLYQIGSELDMMWDGDANAAFNERLGQDQPRFEAMNKAIRQYVQALRDSADVYDSSEADAVQTIQANSNTRR